MSVISFLVNLIVKVVRGTWRLMIRQRAGADVKARPLLDLYALTVAADINLMVAVWTVPGALIGVAVGIPLTALLLLLLRMPHAAAVMLLLRAALTTAAIFTGNHWLLLGLAALMIPQQSWQVRLVLRQSRTLFGRALVYSLVAGGILMLVGLTTNPLVVAAILLLLAGGLAFRLRPSLRLKPPVQPRSFPRQQPRVQDAPEGYHVYRPSSLEDN